MTNFDVITFGSAVLDAFIISPVAKVATSDQVETERALIFPYGSKCEVDELVICSGGGGTNTAVGFSRLGLKVAVVARCGWDFAGKIVRREIKAEKVDDSLFIQVEGEKTDYSTILIGPDGGRTILVYRGGTRLEKTVIDFNRLKAKWFYAASLEGNLKLLAKLTALANKNRVKIAVNPGRREIAQKERLLEIAQDVDVMIINQEEAAILTSSLVNDEQVLEKVFSLLPRTTVVVTQGVKGAVVNSPKEGRLISEGIKVRMADSTGAGDGFGSGLVAGLIKGWGLKKAVQLGTANGASAVTKIGSKPGLIKKKDISLWLEKPVKIRKIG